VTREVSNNVAQVRQRKGWSASTLAAKAGVTRQAIYAIESGAYVPNTAVSLRLAEVLEVSMDSLFRLAVKDSCDDLLAKCEPDIKLGTQVQLGRVDGELVAVAPSSPGCYLPVSDAVTGPRAGKKIRVRPHARDNRLENRLIIAGCDPATSILARYLQRAGVEAVLVHRNSAESLSLLKNKSVHIAGTHLGDASAISSRFSRNTVTITSLATWQEGLITGGSHSQRIKSVEDLARKQIRFVNREKGAGTRLLLDNALARLGIKASQIRGYQREAPGHLAAAAEVNTGAADCCIATEVAARAFGLTFIPLTTARYDLVIRRADLDLPPMRAFFDVLTDARFRRELSASARYDTALTGTQVVSNSAN
jgi:molybdate-binding protein/DNA-binding XRE family transcriptional regulator